MGTIRAAALFFLLAGGCGFEHGMLGSTGSSDAPAASDTLTEPTDAVPPDWAFRRTLTIDNSANGALSSFAVAVILDSTRINYAAMRTDGGDLRFLGADTTSLAYEIERWDPTGRSIIWVQVPAIAANTTTSITMYYGNKSATPGATPAAVWDSDFTGVWHLVDAHDSTGHSTSTNHSATAIAGKVGPALAFGGSQYVDTANTDYLSTWTIEAWVNPASASVATGAASILSNYPDYMLLWSCNGATFCHKAMYNGSNPSTHIADFTISPNEWSYVVGRYDGAALRAYVGGTMTGEETTTDPPMQPTTSAKIGTRMDLLGYFVGGIDEVRISRVARSEDYIRAEMRATTDAYITFGSEQAN